MRCPECGSKINLDELMLSEIIEDIIRKIMPKFGDYGELAYEYIQYFGVFSIVKQARRAKRLLKGLADIFETGKFDFNGKWHGISKRGVVEALVITCNQHFNTFLTNHNFLKKVMIGISEKELKEASRKRDEVLRKRESLPRPVHPENSDDEMTLQEFIDTGDMDVLKLAGKVGRKME